MMKRVILLLIALSFALSACYTTVTGPVTKKKYDSSEDPRYIQETIEQGRLDYIRQHPKLNPNTKRIIMDGRLVKGMSKEEVRASWGPADTIYRTKTNEIVHEQWIYKNIDPVTFDRLNYFLNFKNDKLSTWQEQ